MKVMRFYNFIIGKYVKYNYHAIATILNLVKCIDFNNLIVARIWNVVKYINFNHDLVLQF